MYEVAIIFNEKISDDKIVLITKLLKNLGFTLTVIFQNSSVVMMLYLKNVSDIAIYDIIRII